MVQIATIAESHARIAQALLRRVRHADAARSSATRRRRGDARRPHLLHAHRRLPRIARSDRREGLRAAPGPLRRARRSWRPSAATMAIYAAIRALVGRGDNAVIVSPAYAIFSNGVIMSGGEPRPAPLAHAGRSLRPRSRSRRAPPSTRNTRMLIVNSPSNPTGWVISDDEQRALAEIAERHDLVDPRGRSLRAAGLRRRDRSRRRSRASSPTSRSADRRQQLLEDLQHDRLAPGLGAKQRAHDQDDVQGRGVHDVEPGGDGAAGRHRRAARRRAVHRASCASTTRQRRAQVKAALASLPGVIAAGSAGRLLRVSAIQRVDRLGGVYGRAGSRDRRRARARRRLRP